MVLMHPCWVRIFADTGSISNPIFAQIPPIGIQIGNQDDSDEDELALAIQALLLITILSFGTAIITMMTSFTRIVIVFFFLRMGLGTQQSAKPGIDWSSFVSYDFHNEANN